MCGIAGIYQHEAKRQKRNDARRAVEKINKAQVCRGPDDEGNEVVDKERRVQFGHRRLSILDVSRLGHQPMVWQGVNGKSQIAITYNGEIYNFQELRDELKKKGYGFRTNTDTEVILALYDKYGEESFSKLRGMFAFAIWDEKKKQLVMARDRYGIKPLYYYRSKNIFIFASSVKGLMASGLVHEKENEQAKIGFLLLGSVPAPETTIKNVVSLMPGQYLIKDESGERIREYYRPWEYFGNKKNITIEQARKGIRTILEKVTELHLISDAPLGVFLSGGLDSSALAALAAEKKKNLKTVAVTFQEEKFSEKKYQDEVVRSIKSDHREVVVTRDDFQGGVEEIFAAMDQPTIDGINSFFVAQAAKKAGLKAVWSGLGGDEVFFGYPSFKKATAMRFLQKAVHNIQFLPRLASKFNDRYAKLQYLEQNDVISIYLTFRGLCTPQDIAETLGIATERVWEYIASLRNRLAPIQQQLEALHPADMMAYSELAFYLLNQLLKDTDSMAMHHSIEVRVPFLDHVLVEYMSELPAEMKLKGKVNKELLADAVSDIVPESVRTRKKMGFAFPFEDWLRQDTGLIQKDIPQEIIKQFKAGTLHWSRVWARVVLAKATF